MNKSNINISSQSGVIVTLEVSILMVVCGISAIGFGILLAAHLPEIVAGWLATLAPPGQGGMCPDGSNPPCN